MRDRHGREGVVVTATLPHRGREQNGYHTLSREGIKKW
jgi:hypothetical protein